MLNKDRVLETRTLNEGASIKRRRECEACGRRFTTMEEIEELQLFVVKSNNRREEFDRKKVLKGMELASKGRPIKTEILDEIAQEIERQLYNRLEKEVSSREIGEMVMERLRKLDAIAYIRFASVYKSYPSLQAMRQEMDRLLQEAQQAPEPTEGKEKG